MKILIDAQMPPALAGWLQTHGHEAQALREIGLRDAEDGSIWAYALQTGAVILRPGLTLYLRDGRSEGVME